MSNASPPTCARCGAPISAATTDSICPACLMSGVLRAPSDETISMAAGQWSARSEPTAFPCEFGSYRLRGILGRGGMGTVYDAEQTATARRVALKMLGQGLDSPEMRQRFLREGRLAAGVNHPNSLYIFGSEDVEGEPVITMEIASSGTLKDELKKRGPLPTEEAVDAILDIVAGLEAALAGGVLHRDIKPSNCFVSPDGSVKIGDFGLSVSTLANDDVHITATGAIMGTPAYASPEQLRGDELDVRADIYSVGATLFTLLTGRAPFEGENAVQVVANAVKEAPRPVGELRHDVPPGLEQVVACCLSKDREGRYADYTALRGALMPFSSAEPEPASLLVRAPAGWIDYLIAFLPPYVALMFLVGASELLVRPLVDRTLYSARYYFLFLCIGFLYFSIVEGIWGAGLGKCLKGLRVVRDEGRPPGLGRALLRIVIPVLCVEGVRMPLMLALISDADWTEAQTITYVLAAVVCGWIPVILAWRARREEGYATVWDLASGTRVVIQPKVTDRPPVEPAAPQEMPIEDGEWKGPYQVIRELVPGRWLVATDPVLRRQVWLLRRRSEEVSVARRDLARAGRLRWLQEVKTGTTTWDAFEATPGVPFCSLVAGGHQVPWGTLRNWLHDMASEIWAAGGDGTLPAALSLDHLWITERGQAILLDEPWPAAKTRAESIPVDDLAGQQRFLNAIAEFVESTSLPLHARPVLNNLEAGKFEKLSFFTGSLRGLLDRPAEVSRGIRAGSIFVLPLYVWVAVFVGYYHDKPALHENGWLSLGWKVTTSAVVVLGAIALAQFLALPFRSTASQATFRLAVIDSKGELASRSRLTARWAIVWLPLLLPMSIVAWLIPGAEGIAILVAPVLLLLWLGAAVFTVMHPHRGLHDRLAGTWVVRR